MGPQRKQGEPERLRVHAFLIPELGKANPCGVYDLTQNLGWVSVGVDHDTACYPTGVRVTNADLAGVNLHRDDFHGEWNYTISPRSENRPAIQ